MNQVSKSAVGNRNVVVVVGVRRRQGCEWSGSAPREHHMDEREARE